MTDADDREPRFDPRHDPIFQRGYRPKEDMRADDRVAASHVIPPSAAPHAAPPPAFIASEPPADVAGLNSPPVGAAGLDFPPAELARRNPFIVALWCVGIGLIVGGITLSWWAYSDQELGFSFSYSSSSGEGVPLRLILQQLIWMLSPGMVSAGMLTLIALIFWKAVHWRVPVSAVDSTRIP